MENRLIVPFCCKRLMGYCCHPTGWVGGQRGNHEISDCNNLRMQTWDLYIYTKGASTRWMRGSTGSCQYFYYCGKVRQNHHTHVRIMAVLGLW